MLLAIICATGNLDTYAILLSRQILNIHAAQLKFCTAALPDRGLLLKLIVSFFPDTYYITTRK